MFEFLIYNRINMIFSYLQKFNELRGDMNKTLLYHTNSRRRGPPFAPPLLKWFMQRLYFRSQYQFQKLPNVYLSEYK